MVRLAKLATRLVGVRQVGEDHRAVAKSATPADAGAEFALASEQVANFATCSA